MNTPENAEKFYVKNCALAVMATGERANSLLELRDKLATVNESCLYQHFWGGRMNPQFAHPEHHNDFASWVHLRLHDNALAEKLSIIDPIEYESLEDLRQEVIETIDNRLDESEVVLWTKKENSFHFIRSTVLVFASSIVIEKPEDLPHALPKLPPGSIFYHFIEAKGRTPEGYDDFSLWLRTYPDHYEKLVERFQSIDPYFLTLTQLREELTSTCSEFFESGEHK